MATRSRTQIYMKLRDSLRTHRVRPPRSQIELRDFKVNKSLMAAQSDDEGSTVDARAYVVPPNWVTQVSDLNNDIATIKIKSAPLPAGDVTRSRLSLRAPPLRSTLCHAVLLCPSASCLSSTFRPWRRMQPTGAAAVQSSRSLLVRSLRAGDAVGQGAPPRLWR